jgi:hypothetical protein
LLDTIRQQKTRNPLRDAGFVNLVGRLWMV